MLPKSAGFQCSLWSLHSCAWGGESDRRALPLEGPQANVGQLGDAPAAGLKTAELLPHSQPHRAVRASRR